MGGRASVMGLTVTQVVAIPIHFLQRHLLHRHHRNYRYIVAVNVSFSSSFNVTLEPIGNSNFADFRFLRSSF